MEFYIPKNPLSADQTILFRLGQLCYEGINVRNKRFTLINLFTNHRYNKNTVIAELVDKAYAFHRQNHDDWAKQSLDDASTMLERAKLEAPTLSKYRIIRWLKGTPRINIANLEARIALARQKMGFDVPAEPVQAEPAPAQPKPAEPAPAQPKPAEPAPVKPKQPVVIPLGIKEAREKTIASLTLTQQEVVDLLKEAQKVCTRKNFKHYDMLRKWIIVAESREEVINEYDLQKEETHHGIGFLYEYLPAKLFFHGEKGWMGEKEQDPAIALYKGLEDYALIYQKIRNNPKQLESFFKSTFKGYNACFEGNHLEVSEWAEKEFNKNQDLTINIDAKKDKYQNIGELNRLFDAHQFRSYFKNVYHYDYDEAYDQYFYDQYFNFGEATPEMKKYREENVTKEKLVAFIREQKCLPLQFFDIRLTEENLEAEVNNYFAVVFDEE